MCLSYSSIYMCYLQNNYYLFIYLSGINETNGNERLATLVGLVLQVLNVHADIGGNYDFLFPHKSWRSRSHYVHGPKRNIRVSVAILTRCHDILLPHFDILLKRYVVGF